MARKTTKPKGRPQGSANKTRDTVVGELTRCPVCSSTNRAPYTTREVQHYAGEHRGQPYNQIVRRRTQCLDCGQHRIDMLHEFTPQK